MSEETYKYTNEEIQIRDATKEDMELVSEMFKELIDYLELVLHGPRMSVQELVRDGFETDPPAFWCKIAELNRPTQPAVGFAAYFPTYSLWVGRGMMLQALYVRSSERRRGVGERLFNAVAKETSSTGCKRLEFQVLEWSPACKFYESKGAVNLTKSDQFCCYRLEGDALQEAASD